MFLPLGARYQHLCWTWEFSDMNALLYVFGSWWTYVIFPSWIGFTRRVYLEQNRRLGEIHGVGKDVHLSPENLCSWVIKLVPINHSTFYWSCWWSKSPWKFACGSANPLNYVMYAQNTLASWGDEQSEDWKHLWAQSTAFQMLMKCIKILNITNLSSGTK